MVSSAQTTIPKSIREKLKISVNDALEREIEEDGKVRVYSAQTDFLKYKNSIRVGKGDIKQDIEHGRLLRTEKHPVTSL